jgi:hypothetical protein
MIVLIVIAVWITAVSLLLSLCAAARRSDIEHAEAGAPRSWRSAESAPYQLPCPEVGRPGVGARRTHVAEGSGLARSGSAAA